MCIYIYIVYIYIYIVYICIYIYIYVDHHRCLSGPGGYACMFKQHHILVTSLQPTSGRGARTTKALREPRA